MTGPDRKIKYKAAFTLLEIAIVLVALSLLTTYTAVDAAFTLIEVCLILVVLTVLGGIMLEKLTQDTRRTKVDNLQKKLDKIERALQAFSKINNRLPCPADGTFKRDAAANFGIEAGNPGTCVGAVPAANFDDGLDTVGGV